MGEVPDGDLIIELGNARIAHEGDDVMAVAIGPMVRPTVRAAKKLVKEGIGVEVIDPRSLVPLDSEAIFKSVRRTGRLIIVDESRDVCSAASHISALCADQRFEALKAPIKRVTVPDVALPYSPPLEKAIIPNEARIMSTVKALLGIDQDAETDQ
jgi:pyruvate dehydrogenase E1 component beta subunit